MNLLFIADRINPQTLIQKTWHIAIGKLLLFQQELLPYLNLLLKIQRNIHGIIHATGGAHQSFTFL